jgi:hypothetical protein
MVPGFLTAWQIAISVVFIRHCNLTLLYIIKQFMFTIYPNKMVKSEKVMIVIKQSIDIVNIAEACWV